MDVAIMENSGSDSHCDDGWHDSIERLHRALEPEVPRKIVEKAFGILKLKWQTNDETIDIKNMADFLSINEKLADKIINHYESQHFCIKFKLK